MYEKVPAELRALRQWVCWLGTPDVDRPGKMRKMPVNALTGTPAKVNDPTTWCSFDEAVAASAQYSGIGLIFTEGYVGVDIDGAQDALEEYRYNTDCGNLISEFVHTLQSYTEYSQSGNGIHIICRGKLPEGRRRKGNVEMYDTGRFFIVTGHSCSEYAGISDCTESIKPLHEKYVSGDRNVIKPMPTDAEPVSLEDDELLQKARSARNGKLFIDLYDGDWQSYYNSQSEADMALCNSLAFWTGRDPMQMDRLFRSSGLMREKWDRRQSGSTYGALTIERACKDCASVYTPHEQYSITIGHRPAETRKRYTFDDTGNAQRIVDNYGEDLLYSYVAKRWLYWDGRKWVYDYEGKVKLMVDDVVARMPLDKDLYEDSDAYNKHCSKTRSSASKTAMLKEAEHQMPILPEKLDMHSNLLNTVSGIVNLQNGTMVDHDKEQLMTKITNAEYTTTADCPIWLGFIETIFGGDRELIRYIQKAVGYSLTGSTEEQCVFFMYGEGRNGKSTFLDTIADILGDYATNIQPDSLMVRQSGGGTSDIARLVGSRFVTSMEPGDGMRLNEGLLKQLTGGDKITAAKKYENEFEFRTEFKLWMAMNHKPLIRGTDEGIWRRIHLIPFTVTIPDDKVDRRLKYKLRKEMPAILKWAVDGCLMWRREGLKRPACVEEATREYRASMDTMGAFLSECCERGPREVGAAELFKVYTEWAKENNEYTMTATKFGTEMAKRFDRKKAHGTMAYVGIGLKSDFKPYQVTFGGGLGRV
jgi:putative DNA primase/helicase